MNQLPAWLAKGRSWVLLLFAWSLPVSLFGMQAGVGLGVLLLGALAVATRGRLFERTPLDGPIILLLAAIASSLMLAPRGATTATTATSFWVVLAFYVTRFLLDSERTLRRALAGILILACAASLFSVFQSLTGQYPLGHLIHPDVKVLLKPVPGLPDKIGGVGLFFSRLTLAHVLLFPVCWAVALALEPLRPRNRFLLILAILVLCAGLFFTWTRAGLAVAAAAALVLVVTRMKFKRAILVAAAVLLMGGATLAIAPGALDRMQRSFSGTRDWGRLTIWQTALDLADRNPLSGVGYGNYQRDAMPRIREQAKTVGRQKIPGVVAWAHGNLLTFLAEAGLFGAFAFCFLFVAYFRSAAHLLKKLPPERLLLRAFVRGCMAAAGAFLAVGMVHDTFFDGEVIFCLWFTLGATFAAGKLAPEGEGGW